MIPGAALLSLMLLRTRRFRKQLGILLGIILICTMTALSGCANSMTVNNTPAGTYIFQVIATGQNSGVVQSGAVTLTVTQ
jgi:hypothetical protein